MTNILDIKNLNIRYKSLFGYVEALKNLNFSLIAGEVVALVGESGSGKTSAGLAMMGLLGNNAKVSGYIDLYQKNHNILNYSETQWSQIRGLEMAMVFQDPMTSLNPYLTIGFQIMEPLLCHGVDKAQATQQAIELLQQVEIANPHQALQSYPHQFSGGMRQRVVIAIALAAQPKILIADEPTTALDVITQKQILKLFAKRIKNQQMGVVLITHDLGIVAELCNRVVVLKDGNVIEEANVPDIYSAPCHKYTKALLQAVARIDAPSKVLPLSNNNVILNISNVSVAYQNTKLSIFKSNKDVDVVSNIDLDIKYGEILGLVGQSGSGKSTLLKAIANLLPIKGGHINFADKSKHIQMVFQDPRSSLDSKMIAVDIIAEPLLNFKICSKDQAYKLALEMMKKVKLDIESANRFPHEFSGGQCQRIGIARALILKPSLLLCDEPVSALDVSIQAEILDLLIELQQDLNLSMLFVSHDLAVVRSIAHRVAVMYRGQIVEVKSADDIYTKPTHNYTKELLSAIPVIP